MANCSSQNPQSGLQTATSDTGDIFMTINNFHAESVLQYPGGLFAPASIETRQGIDLKFPIPNATQCGRVAACGYPAFDR